MSKEDPVKTVCFDYSHHNTLTIESPSFSDFTQFLFGSSFRLGKIQAGFTNLEKLQNYKMVIIGGPRESLFTVDEIKVLVEYVKKGGSLLLISDEGGDYSCNTNLSHLSSEFGFEYNTDVLSDSMNFQGIESRVIVTDFEPHAVSQHVDAIVQSNACSIYINELVEADKNIKILPLARTSLNAYRKRWDGEEWIEQDDAPKSVVAVAVDFYEGRVVGLCTNSMFSSLSSAYGYFAKKNEAFIANIFRWLLESREKGGFGRDSKITNVAINMSLFIWMEKLVEEKKWQNFHDIINFSIKYLKDNYDQVINYAEKRREQLQKEREKQLQAIAKIEDQKERERRAAIFGAEDAILDIPSQGIDTSQDLHEIMASLRDITGGAIGKDFDARMTREEPPTPAPTSTDATIITHGKYFIPSKN